LQQKIIACFEKQCVLGLAKSIYYLCKTPVKGGTRVYEVNFMCWYGGFGFESDRKLFTLPLFIKMSKSVALNLTIGGSRHEIFFFSSLSLTLRNFHHFIYFFLQKPC